MPASSLHASPAERPAHISVLTVAEPYRAFVEVTQALFPVRVVLLFAASAVAAGAFIHTTARLEISVTIDPVA